MNLTQIQEKPKPKATNLGMCSIKVRPDTKKKLVKELLRVNKEKEFGKRIKADDYISLCLTLIRPEHVEKLKEASLSNSDRLEQAYSQYVKIHPTASKDEFYGFLLRSRIEEVTLGTSKPAILTVV